MLCVEIKGTEREWEKKYVNGSASINVIYFLPHSDAHSYAAMS